MDGSLHVASQTLPAPPLTKIDSKGYAFLISLSSETRDHSRPCLLVTTDKYLRFRRSPIITFYRIALTLVKGTSVVVFLIIIYHFPLFLLSTLDLSHHILLNQYRHTTSDGEDIFHSSSSMSLNKKEEIGMLLYSSRIESRGVLQSFPTLHKPSITPQSPHPISLYAVLNPGVKDNCRWYTLGDWQGVRGRGQNMWDRWHEHGGGKWQSNSKNVGTPWRHILAGIEYLTASTIKGRRVVGVLTQDI